jgi:hypothetical protein
MNARTTLSATLMGFGSLAVLLMAMPQKAAAYVDPGSGALVWQMAAAALFGSLFRIRRIVTWVRARFEPAATPRRDETAAGGRNTMR